MRPTCSGNKVEDGLRNFPDQAITILHAAVYRLQLRVNTTLVKPQW